MTQLHIWWPRGHRSCPGKFLTVELIHNDVVKISRTWKVWYR